MIERDVASARQISSRDMADDTAFRLGISVRTSNRFGRRPINPRDPFSLQGESTSKAAFVVEAGRVGRAGPNC